MAADDGDFFNGFVDAFNRALVATGAQVRIAFASDDRPAGKMQILDVAGNGLGWLPDTIEPQELAVIAELLADCYRRGVEDGRSGSTRSFLLKQRPVPEPLGSDPHIQTAR